MGSNLTRFRVFNYPFFNQFVHPQIVLKKSLEEVQPDPWWKKLKLVYNVSPFESVGEVRRRDVGIDPFVFLLTNYKFKKATPSGELFASVLPSVAHLRSAGGTPLQPTCTPPLNSVKCYGELCAKCNFYLCPFAIGILENRTVSLVGLLPILLIQFEHFGFSFFQIMVHVFSWCTTICLIVSGDLKKSENWDPMLFSY